MGSGWYETWGEKRIFGKMEATLNMRKKIFCDWKACLWEKQDKKESSSPSHCGALTYLISLASSHFFSDSSTTLAYNADAV